MLATAPWWLTLLDVDEAPVAAASIYAGGPPWLLPPVEKEAAFDQKPERTTIVVPGQAEACAPSHLR